MIGLIIVIVIVALVIFLIVRQLSKDKKHFEELKLKADGGDVAAQYELGILLSKKIKLEEAYSLFQKAADQGEARAQYQAARCILLGLGTTQDEARGIDLLKKISDAGNGDATAELAFYHLKKSEYNKAKELITVAKKQGIDKSLSDKLDNQLTCKSELYVQAENDAEAGSFENAYNLFQKAADQGETRAQIQAARCVLLGIGTTRDEARGLELLKKISDAGNGDATAELAFRHFLKKNYDKAKELVEIAEKQGISDTDLKYELDFQLTRTRDEYLKAESAVAVKMFSYGSNYYVKVYKTTGMRIFCLM
jgi:TPR repeat protein